MKDITDLGQNMIDWLSSEEGKASLHEFANELNEKYELASKRYKKFTAYLEKHSFDDLIQRLIKEHDEAYIDNCYKNHYMPCPNNKLYFLTEYLNDQLIPLKDVEGIKSDYPGDEIYFFKGYYFQIVSFHTGWTAIFDKDKKLLMSI